VDVLGLSEMTTLSERRSRSACNDGSRLTSPACGRVPESMTASALAAAVLDMDIKS
jgi:hypothetical protein